MSILKKAFTTGVVAAALGVTATAGASSHREAPAIAEDQFADNTDVYMFISPASPDRVVLVANYVPLLLPASGPNFYRFGDSVLYEMRIDNDGDAVADVAYEFRFRTAVGDDGTFLYNLGGITSPTLAAGNGLNVAQTYTVTRRDLEGGAATTFAENVPVAPWYVGSRSFAGAMGSNADANYENVARMAVHDGGSGRRVFAGPRAEPFFVDLHVFDLLGVAGAQTTYGANVMSIVLEVPITDLTASGARASATEGNPAMSPVLGYYAAASRRQVRILRRNRGADHLGQWVQVSRLGWPLVNEVLIPLRDKDRFNRTRPDGDVANFGAYLLDPQLPDLLELVLGGALGFTCVDADVTTAPRNDVVGLLSGGFFAPEVPGLAPADLLRLDVRAGQTNAGSHFPNGRALADDVTDTELNVLCGATDAMGMPVVLGDGVDPPDGDPATTDSVRDYQTAFPYLATPYSGNP